jgi:hypothetical protein
LLLGLRLGLLLTAAVATPAAIGAWAALAVLAPALPIQLLAHPASGAGGLGDGPAEQRQDYRGGDQTFHFVLQRALCWARRSSLVCSFGPAP